MNLALRTRCGPALATVLAAATAAAADFRAEHFNSPPAWSGVNNAPDSPPCVAVSQDFGYSTATRFSGGGTGEIGGTLWRSAAPASYARSIPTKTFRDPLSASGTLTVLRAAPRSALMLGWFNSTSPPGWRNLNSLALRLDGEQDCFRVYCEYGTRLKRTGSTDINRRTNTKHPAGGTVHTWSIRYDPEAGGGEGAIAFSLDGETTLLPLAPGHKLDGAEFDRFGLWNRQTEAGGPIEAYINELVLDGVRQDFSIDPNWIEKSSRVAFTDCEVRPRHRFGFRPSHEAGGLEAGEMGGILWRTESREPETAGYYADDRIGVLTLTNRLWACGRLSMPRTCVDSGLFLGWFNTNTFATASAPGALLPRRFLGAVVESTSDEGQKLNAAWSGALDRFAIARNSPRLVPPTGPLDWTIEYTPELPAGNLTVTVGGQKSILTVPRSVRTEGVDFNAFGIGTTRKGGHWVEMFFDDLVYSVGGAAGL